MFLFSFNLYKVEKNPSHFHLVPFLYFKIKDFFSHTYRVLHAPETERKAATIVSILYATTTKTPCYFHIVETYVNSKAYYDLHSVWGETE